MSKRRIVVAFVALAFAQMLFAHDALARGPRGGGGMRGGARPASRPMPAQRPATPAQRPTNPGGGFNFNNDIGRPPTASQLPSGPGIGNRPGGPGNGGGIGNRPPIAGRPPVAPIVPPGPAWGWNGGVIWYPAYGYWGGGFWGPWGYGYYGPYYGTYVYSETKEEVKSYEVAPDSAGAKVLQAYGLAQTQCGPPEGLVIVLGPEESVICAQPNNTVTAGTYQLDTTNLTLVSAT